MQHLALDSFLVISLLWAAGMRMQQLRHLHILPNLLHQLCSLADSLAQLGPPMKVCLTFRYFGILHQSNLAPR